MDLLLGGDTHTFFTAPEVYKNSEGKQVLVNQVGWAGIYLGQVDIYFDHKKRSKAGVAAPIKISALQG